MGDKGYEASDQIRKKDEPRILYEDSEGGKNDLENDETSFLSEMITECMWRTVGWTWNTRPRSVLTTLKYDEGW